MERPTLGMLFLHFLVLAFLAIGGAPTILPALHRYVVETHQWLTSPQFADAYVSLSELNDVSSELFVVFRLCEETRYTTQDFLILIAY